jgi:hypothetical protein
MLYDEHRVLGREHARRGEPRYVWKDPHLQKAYDEGYRSVIEPAFCLHCGQRGIHDCPSQRANIAGFPGRAFKIRV